MTRINLVHPTELYDQHLFSEWREIKMVPKSLARSLQAGANRYCKLHGNHGEEDPVRDAYAMNHVLQRIPRFYTLNKEHVSFFYDKGFYLQNRYSELSRELLRRKSVDFNRNALLDPDGVFESLDLRFKHDYVPTNTALLLIRERIAERVALQPDWYRMTNPLLTTGNKMAQSDFIISTYCIRSGRQQPLHGVCVYHKPSQLEYRCHSERGDNANFRLAYHKLTELVFYWEVDNYTLKARHIGE